MFLAATMVGWIGGRRSVHRMAADKSMFPRSILHKYGASAKQKDTTVT